MSSAMPRNPVGPSLLGVGHQSPLGFSLVELLIAMVVVGIFMGGVYGLFLHFLGASGEQAALSKQGFDARLGLQLIKRDLASAGFGLDRGELNQAVSGSGTSVTIESTAVHGRTAAGQHGVIQAGGSVPGIAGGTCGVAMTPEREWLAVGELGSLGVAARNLFFAGNQDACPYDPDNPPDYFFARAYGLSTSTDSECAPGTPNLQYEDYPSRDKGGFGGIVNCVLDLQIRYGFQMNAGDVDFTTDPDTPPAGTADSFPDLLKIGMIFQAGQGHRNRTVTAGPLNYQDPDLELDTGVDLSAEQQNYRWQALEWTARLVNFP